MIILGLDASHNRCSVALSDGDKVIDAIISQNNSAQAEELINMIERLLRKTNQSYDTIDYLAVTHGPGSFTGIRIGLAAARGIIMGSKIRPISVSCFDVINFRTMLGAKKYDHSIVLLNAHRSQLYALSYDIEGLPSCKPSLIDIIDVDAYVASFKGKIVVAGSGVELVKPQANVLYLPRFSQTDARSLCKASNYLLNKGAYSSDLSPLYIRLPDAKLPKTFI